MLWEHCRCLQLSKKRKMRFTKKKEVEKMGITYTIVIDKETKKNVEKKCAERGITVQDWANGVVKKFIKENHAELQLKFCANATSYNS